MPLKSVSKSPIHNKTSLVQVLASSQTDDKQPPEPTMTKLQWHKDMSPVAPFANMV